MSPDLNEFEAFIHREIPITAQQGIRLVQWDESGLQLAAPLGVNANDKGSAFAGSQYSIAVLAGWGLLMLHLDQSERRGEVAIFKSEMEFSRPIRSDYRALALRPGVELLSEYEAALARRGRGRLELVCELHDSDGVASRMLGQYATKLVEE